MVYKLVAYLFVCFYRLVVILREVAFSIPCRVKPKTRQYVFFSTINTRYVGERAHTCRLGIRIMYLRQPTCHPVDYFFVKNGVKNQDKLVGSDQAGSLFWSYCIMMMPKLY